MATLTEQLDLMLTLGPNWDGYEADPPLPDVIEVAKEFIGVLHVLLGRGGDETEMYVAPGRAGGVQVGWADDSAEYETDIDADGSFGFLSEDKATGEMSEERYRADLSAVPPALLARLQTLASRG